MRILVLIAIGLLLYFIIGNYMRQKRVRPPQSDTEKMVRCQHCGLHILEQEAIKAEGNFYCSRSHLEADTSSK